MTTQQILKDLKALGDPRAIAIWKRGGMPTDNFFGVNLTKLGAYAKKLKKNHELALELWNSGVHDARLLATMIEEPNKVTVEQIERWVKDADFWDLTDRICKNVVSKTPFALEKMRTWMKSNDEFVKRAGYMVLKELARQKDAGQAKADSALSDETLAEHLAVIERDIQTEKNWVKEAMNYALIAIGSRNKPLNRRALDAANRIGKVDVDYGDSSCKAPDAVAYLKKAQGKFS